MRCRSVSAWVTDAIALGGGDSRQLWWIDQNGLRVVLCRFAKAR